MIDRATYEKPTEFSEGIRFVVVNGRIALRDGEPTGVKAGRALRRTRRMPSRPMNIAPSGELRAEGRDADRRITVDLANAQLRVTGRGMELQGTEFGLLQTAPRWSSVTGLVRDASTGAALGFVLIVDDVGGRVTLQVDGRPWLAWKLTTRSGNKRPA